MTKQSPKQSMDQQFLDMFDLKKPAINHDQLRQWMKALEEPINEREVVHEVEGMFLKYPEVQKAFPMLKEQTQEAVLRGISLTQSFCEHLIREDTVEPINKTAYRILVTNIVRMFMSSAAAEYDMLVLSTEIRKVTNIIDKQLPSVLLHNMLESLLRNTGGSKD